MKCVNCGAELDGSGDCEYCGSHYKPFWRLINYEEREFFDGFQTQIDKYYTVYNPKSTKILDYYEYDSMLRKGFIKQ